MDTTITSSTTHQQEQDMFRTISLTALLTGTLDITAAIIKFYIDTNRSAVLKLTSDQEAGPVSFITFLTHGGPDRIFKFIARGIFGNDVTTDGTLMIIWGIVFHFMIAFLFTAFLFLIYPKVVRWIKNKFLVGIFYGLFIWAIMNLVVLPLSRLPDPKSFDITQALIGALILICMIGIPIALIAHKYYSSRRHTA
jgi:hypothetical protein